MSMTDSDNEQITVLLVDDHPMVQQGLLSCLSFYDDINIVGTVFNGNEAITATEELSPDIVLMDISMPTMNGIDATEILLEKSPNTKVLIFSMHENSEYVTSAVQAGASGYIIKDTSTEEVYKAIKQVHGGEHYFSHSVAKILIEKPLRFDNEKLTTREQMILAHIAKGYSSKEIANTLNISIRTVEAHRRNIKSKINADSLAEMIHYAINNGLVDPSN
ncbi:response regulator transcription factor [Paraneptunicella aestuarii]|uniref:response regulator transcription factor n=1 Tax=Paraneptunicella aestuarii TaxID=2831148 RepID=UPI002FC7ADB1